MKTDELDNQDDLNDYKPGDKKGRKVKAQISKVSKTSNMTRRRQQPDSSEENLLPENIPQSTGTEFTLTEGFENQLSKITITVPYSLLQGQKFENLVQARVQNVRVVFSVEKQMDNITVFAKLPQSSKKMEVEDQYKIKQPTSANDGQKVEDSSSLVNEQQIIPVNFWGKYVYISGYDPQNKTIKRIRKQLSSIQFGEIGKFKIKQPYSDLFIYFNIRLDQYYTNDYIGLVNQGNTCYMNSYLQTLYHIPAFRNLVYEAEIQDENKFPATLQELFFNLDTSQKSVSPQALLKSFGWSKKQAQIQQDAQQFSIIFFEALQLKLNDSTPKMGYRNRTIQGLFKGSLNHYIRCTNVGTVIDYTDFRNENYEEFLDIQVSIMPTLTESLDAYTTEVHLEGDNAYHTEDHGHQQAYKGVKLGYLPPVLMIQLKRFQYIPEEGKNLKILASLQYQEEIDFSRWSTSTEKEIYELFAVLVHEGSRAESGHYYNYVKDGDQWYKFNDENVQKVPRQKAFNYNFGGFHETIDLNSKQMKVHKKFIESKTTAYMLVYVKKSLKSEIFFDEGKLPEWIENKNINKLQMEEEKKNKKHFFHNVGFIDWSTNLQSYICSDNGFLLNESILESAKTVIPQIPKEANLEQWLVENKLIEPKEPQVEQKKKKSKKAKSDSQQNVEQKESGIYVFYCSDRQLLTGFAHKANHTTTDLLKLSTDPIILKAPFQARKDEYMGVIKRYKVSKQHGIIETLFTYDTVLPIRKEITYKQLLGQLKEKLIKSLPESSQKSEDLDKFMQYNFYIDDLKNGAMNLSQYHGPVQLPSPKFNQLLVCVVEEISFEMTQEEALLHSFPKYYQIKKNMIELTVVEEKGVPLFVKRSVPGSETLSGLRKLVFENLAQEKQAEYGSPENIVLKARLKKTSKNYTQASEPQYQTVKDITKNEERIEFTFSALTIESRLSQFMLQIHYRNRNRLISDPINLVVNRNQTGETLVKIIKCHPSILEMLENDGFTEDQSEIILMTKTRVVINDIVTDQGKVIGKGDFDTVIKKQKNAVIVVEGRRIMEMERQSNLEIDTQQIEPVVNVLLHHATNDGQRIGTPIYFKVDRRMQLSELRAKILDLIKDQTFFWEGKFYVFNIQKNIDATLIFLSGKDSKKVIELKDLQTEEEMKKLSIQEKANNVETKRKKSKQVICPSRKQSNIEQIKQDPLNTVVKTSKQEEPLINGHDIIDVDKEEQKVIDADKVIDISDDVIEKQQKKEESEEQKQGDPIQQAEIVQMSGPQTIFGVFPKPKVLKIQVQHGYIVRPMNTLKICKD